MRNPFKKKQTEVAKPETHYERIFYSPIVDIKTRCDTAVWALERTNLVLQNMRLAQIHESWTEEERENHHKAILYTIAALKAAAVAVEKTSEHLVDYHYLERVTYYGEKK